MDKIAATPIEDSLADRLRSKNNVAKSIVREGDYKAKKYNDKSQKYFAGSIAAGLGTAIGGLTTAAAHMDKFKKTRNIAAGLTAASLIGTAVTGYKSSKNRNKAKSIKNEYVNNAREYSKKNKIDTSSYTPNQVDTAKDMASWKSNSEYKQYH